MGTQKLVCGLFLCFLAFNCFTASGSQPKRKLVTEEVNVLRHVSKQLGKTNWNFSVDPCSGKGNWARPSTDKGFQSYVECNCSFHNNTACHVISIVLKSENLSGVLPPELHRLQFLQQLDLSRNFLSGTVPSKWATMRLEGLALMGNRLSGPFPKVLTKITTLSNLSIEANRFSGTVPPELGNLINLQKLIISANELSGELPKTLAKLKKLTDVRISSNNFTGKIPDLIWKWTQVEKLHIQGCSFEGPIPSGISALTSLSDLRLSDINGRISFPPLSKMESMRTLILRNCSLYGNIPGYIGDMKKLKNLDLSFNSLTGEIPSSFVQLKKVDFMYLTRNMLTGPIPTWILKTNKNMDISYNNFTWESSGPSECAQGSVNVVGSLSSEADKLSRVHSCLKKNFPCADPSKKHHYSLYINCGGKEAIVNGTKYEADVEPRGASMLYLTQTWAFSSTGNFMDNDVDADIYIATNTSKISIPDSELYTTARVSPLSLTYYGLCLINGNYTVKLHFAEIIFTNDSKFTSLGKRIFDVFIQGKLVMKDFNIEDAAGGPGKAIIKTFVAAVTNHTLEIHLYWAGKGTTSIPTRGVYGPLISAISVDPNFKPPSFGDKNARVKIIAGVLAASFMIILVLGILWRKGWLGGKASMYDDLRGLDLQMGYFTLKQIKAATKNFDAANKVGEGGFGSVYKGLLSDGTVIAVKQLSSKSKQGNREFVNEIGMISALQHQNLVKLYGCCIEGHQLMLVYEYMENNCLAKALFGRDVQSRLKLDWPTRRKICLGIARGLVYLHEESRLKIVHRDIKASNVLLDKDLNAKISDFGLAKLDEEDKTHISTRVAGTIGYMAPEYAMRGYLTYKADVYSFGVVALETVSGKSNTNYRPKEEFVYLLDWAYVLQERGNLLELVDPNLGSEFSVEEATLMLSVALLCTNASPTLRPTMSSVVSMLEGHTAIQPPISGHGLSSASSRYKSTRSNFWQCPSQVSINGTFSDSSESIQDKEESEILLMKNSVISIQ
ncbi:putative LRR receptor-like serine/threonine-protein kinase isoform X1 [Cinnamomum micranthum f. kanehirae]|uniref:non-specific serine/threonine protein kinase n=1 Tax=Cinnamomum micranthum f. kanehirae TaxID=337451 RepID=A0A3S3NF89_9MAGN|nr:putative LRR receptor-like serine/threonine-protein kinase isoform X1 [Cinnamomum micranthum f. kanehirae]